MANSTEELLSNMASQVGEVWDGLAAKMEVKIHNGEEIDPNNLTFSAFSAMIKPAAQVDNDGIENHQLRVITYAKQKDPAAYKAALSDNLKDIVYFDKDMPKALDAAFAELDAKAEAAREKAKIERERGDSGILEAEKQELIAKELKLVKASLEAAIVYSDVELLYICAAKGPTLDKLMSVQLPKMRALTERLDRQVNNRFISEIFRPLNPDGDKVKKFFWNFVKYALIIAALVGIAVGLSVIGLPIWLTALSTAASGLVMGLMTSGLSKSLTGASERSDQQEKKDADKSITAFVKKATERVHVEESDISGLEFIGTCPKLGRDLGKAVPFVFKRESEAMAAAPKEGPEARILLPRRVSRQD
jgi:hypothetical protein